MASDLALPAHLLLVDGRAVAPLVVASGAWARGIGLLGRRSFEGAFLLPGVRSVHAVGMRFALDVARVDADLRVVRVDRLEPRQLLSGRIGERHALEAEAGRFAAWGLGPGSVLGVLDAGVVGSESTSNRSRRAR